jgi:glycosyltransferase involved in cell wall biosynthesis
VFLFARRVWDSPDDGFAIHFPADSRTNAKEFAMDGRTDPRVVLVHDWLTGMRGGEKCLEPLCQRWPAAELCTLFHARGRLSPAIEAMTIRPSFFQHIPGIASCYRQLLPLMPFAMRGLRIVHADLVVSLSHCVAKGVRVPHGVPHVCYCFTPMRYIWHMRSAYLTQRQRLLGLPLELLIRALQWWDRKTAEGVTHFIAISETVRQHIRDCYGRDSTVIYPPVDTSFYTPARVRREDHYLIVSALVPYKRIELAIQACNQLGRHLLIIGQGPEEAKLRAVAGPTIHFAGWQPDEVIREHLQRCQALLFPGEEDFGIVPLEASACGAPVIALGRGGATETIIPWGLTKEPTGMYFAEQQPEFLADTIMGFERHTGDFSPQVSRRQALRFSKERFEAELFGYLDEVLGAAPKQMRRAA